jgi:hypothetical protein
MKPPEPLYCTHCGAEDFCCECSQDQLAGPYCEICGVIPVTGTECWKNSESRGCENSEGDIE